MRHSVGERSGFQAHPSGQRTAVGAGSPTERDEVGNRWHRVIARQCDAQFALDAIGTLGEIHPPVANHHEFRDLEARRSQRVGQQAAGLGTGADLRLVHDDDGCRAPVAANMVEHSGRDHTVLGGPRRQVHTLDESEMTAAQPDEHEAVVEAVPELIGQHHHEIERGSHMDHRHAGDPSPAAPPDGMPRWRTVDGGTSVQRPGDKRHPRGARGESPGLRISRRREDLRSTARGQLDRANGYDTTRERTVCAPGRWAHSAFAAS